MSDTEYIEGVIENWSDPTPCRGQFRVTIRIADTLMGFFGSEEEIQALSAKFPVGAPVKCKIVKKGQWTNLVANTMEAIEPTHASTQKHTEPVQAIPTYKPDYQATADEKNLSMNIYGNMEMAVRLLELSAESKKKSIHDLKTELINLTQGLTEWKQEYIAALLDPAKPETKTDDPTPKEEIVM